MKRIVLLVALPVLLLLVWAISGSGDDAPAAKIRVETTDVRGTRNTLVDKLSAAGATVRSETGAGDEDTPTTVTFEVPVAGLEGALAIVHANADVIEKTVDLDMSFTEVKSVESGLDTLDSCLDRALQHVNSQATAAAKSSITECRAQLDRTLARVEANADFAEPVQLQIDVDKRGTTNVVLILFTIVIVAGLGAAAVWLVRSTRSETVIDMRPTRVQKQHHDELYQRRN